MKNNASLSTAVLPSPLDVARDVIVSTYAPFTQKVIQDGVSCSFKEEDKETGGTYSPKLLGTAPSVEINSAFSDAPYMVGLFLEHEAVHHDQCKMEEDWLHPIGTHPSAFPIIRRAIELEAYGHTYHKLLIDTKQGNLSLGQASNALFRLSHGSSYFICAYSGRSPTRNPFVLAHDLRKIMQQRAIQSPHQYFGRFFLSFSQSKVIGRYAAPAAQFQSSVVEMMLRFKKPCPKRFFNAAFGIREMRELFSRNGEDLLASLSPSQHNELHRNISFLNDQDRAAVGAVKEKVKVLRTISAVRCI